VQLLVDHPSIGYEMLCICSGAQPRIIASHPNVIGIRDLLSVADMTRRLSSARKVIIVGNGGIALELVHAVSYSLQINGIQTQGFIFLTCHYNTNDS
jgi:pyruvate/2-oxoglutarate dehydrogenase complex dihydrolipoamide dehydrogenase (E3) component